MFARSAFRAAQPLRMQARRFATETGPSAAKPAAAAAAGATPKAAAAAAPPPPPPASGGGKGAIVYVLGGAVLGGGYYYYSTQAGAAPKQPAKPAFTGGDQGFLSLKLAEVVDVNHNTKRFRFELPEKDMVPGLPIASAVLAKYKGENDAKATLRPYTPINDENEPGYVELLVKQYPDGPMSTHIHNLQPGQTLDIKGPLPKYAWAENKHDHIGLIAGGTGITPMFQLARGIFQNANDKTKVTVVFGNVSKEDILLKKELEELENTYPQRFRAFYVLDKAPQEWQGSTGFITKDLLKTVLPEPKSENIKIFVCGPPGLMKAISGAKVSPKDQGELSGALQELGYNKDQVYKF
ncbi:NADH-cytochrome b5 reductase [Cordyceps javanica]|uniref:NADH-cytochrome b5 reductase n=1 Tax=Cordyceps javanica TaxID=43265 RepID=A0A545VA13_9HYPO|nr:NADH-cytochrome b5 reductase [Cordyceps javanica]TQW09769.1 NADH-cytochrome b5 reductase [Cordyceps javanica]